MSVVEIKWVARLPLGRGGVDPLITRNVAFQGLERIGPEARKAVQLQLQEHARRRSAAGQCESLHDDAACPAVGSVFESPYAFDDPAVDKRDRKSTRLNSSHPSISYAVFCLKKKHPETRYCPTRQPAPYAGERYKIAVKR